MDRYRPDRCPGALRPWPADDGLLVRLRLPGGRVGATALDALGRFAERYGDGHVHVTSRSNLQVRGLPGASDLPADVLAELEATGLLPSRTHDLARNVMASPRTGLASAPADLRPVLRALDAAICGDPVLGGLPGRFLFVLDDGTGDLLGATCDLGLVALDDAHGQLRVGDGWGDVVPVSSAHEELVVLARAFLRARGGGPSAAWHVRELPSPLVPARSPDPRVPSPAPPLPYGAVPGGRHVPVPSDGLDRSAVERLCAAAPELVVTPWRGVLIPEENR